MQRSLPQRLAHGYRRQDDQWLEEKQLPDGAFGAMGGMLTSISDLSKYVGAFLAAFPPRVRHYLYANYGNLWGSLKIYSPRFGARTGSSRARRSATSRRVVR